MTTSWSEESSTPADIDLDVIQFHAARLRSALEAAPFDADHGNLSGFPSECCHHACKVLRIYLEEQGVHGFSFISGKHPRDKRGKHWWLQRGNVIVDITADQFGSSHPSVIVTQESPWHESLAGVTQICDAEAYDRIYESYRKAGVLDLVWDELRRLDVDGLA